MTTPTTTARAQTLFAQHLDRVHRERDLLFAWLMAAQWLFAVVAALVYSPYTWAGRSYHLHVHVLFALVGGASLSVPAMLLARHRPGAALTRHVMAVSQMLWSALLIHLTGGRIETHFHIFGSLAFLAFYRDVRVLVTATLVVVADHLLRGLAWPQSIYGISNPEWWRFLEHTLWVLFEDIVLAMGIRGMWREMRALAERQAETESVNAIIELKVAERTHELAASREQYRNLLETTRTVPFQWDERAKVFTYVGPQGPALLGCSLEEWLAPNFWERRQDPAEQAATRQRWMAQRGSGRDVEVELRLRRDDGTWVWTRCMARSDGQLAHGVLVDITEQRTMELELRQAQKLEAVGRLAAGIAHEINTPVQFVNDSVHFVRDAVADVFTLVDGLVGVRAAMLAGAPVAETMARATACEAEAELPYLREHVPRALERSLEGLQRVATIVRSMKEFAHPDSRSMAPIDLNRAIESTLAIARHEYKYVADVVTDLGALPPVTCHAGQINQVVLNIVVNAAHAIGDRVGRGDVRGRIVVRTRQELASAVIAIQDDGVGIPEAVRERIFDPFFTTKAVGQGTGQGLAIARSVVIEKHGGELTFESEVGKGTTFFIRLPLAGRVAAANRRAS